jgi:hypothetical protein
VLRFNWEAAVIRGGFAAAQIAGRTARTLNRRSTL